MKRTTLKFLIVMSVCIFTKYYSQSDQITINPDMVISINVDRIEHLPENSTIDIPDLTFKSEKELQKFCKVMSFDFYTLSGNYDAKQITISFNKKYLLERQFTVEKMNSFFLDLSGRLKFTYKKLNQL